MIKINDDVFVLKEDVVTIQKEVVEKYRSSSPSDCSTYIDFEGSVITMKNGRKIFVRNKTPNEIMEILNDPK